MGESGPLKVSLPALSCSVALQTLFSNILLILCGCFVNAQNDEAGPGVPRLNDSL